MPGPKIKKKSRRRFCASLCDRNAQGHVTRAFACENLREKCPGQRSGRQDWDERFASLHSRNAHGHVRRSILRQTRQKNGRAQDCAIPRICVRLEISEELFFARTYKKNAGAQDQGDLKVAAQASCEPAQSEVQQDHSCALFDEKLQARDPCLARAGAIEKPFYRKICRPGRAQDQDARFVRARVHMGMSEDPFCARRIMGTNIGCASMHCRSAHGHLTRAILCEFPGKMPWPKVKKKSRRRSCASLCDRNAQGHVTRAFACENLREKCPGQRSGRQDWDERFASLHSRNAHGHVRRSILRQTRQKNGRAQDCAIPRICVRLEMSEELFFARTYKKNAGAQDQGDLKVAAQASCKPAQSEVQQDHSCALFDEKLQARDPCLARAGAVEKPFYRKICRPGRAQDRDARFVRARVHMGMSEDPFCARRIMGTNIGCASMHCRSAHGHLTRAILCEFTGKMPWPKVKKKSRRRSCASLRSRNARGHLTRAI